MEVVVCIKPSPDPSIISLNPLGSIEDEDLVPIIGPMDLTALNEAFKLKEAGAVKSVTVLSLAPPELDSTLRTCMALGADKINRIWDPAYSRSDSHAIGLILGKAIRHLSPGLVLCCQRSLDRQMGYAGYVMAQTAGIPFLPGIIDMRFLKSDLMMVERRLEHGKREKIETCLPVILGLAETASESPYASLPSLMDALRKEIESLRLGSLSVHEDDISPLIEVMGFSLPRLRPKRVFTPSSKLSAAERIRLVMSGGVAEKKTDLLEGSPKELAVRFLDVLRQVIVEEPVIKP